MQQQPFTGTQTASVPILSTLARPPAKKMAAAKLSPASRLASTKISNINAPLRQKQQQQLRVNTGKDLAVLTSG
jgi:hypothetical protein